MQPNEYEFITNPTQPKKAGGIGGPNSSVMRAAIAGGGLILLIIAFVVVKNLLAGSSPFLAYVSLMQDQDEIVHLATAATQEPTISETNKNFSLNAQLTMTSAEHQYGVYLTSNKQKITPKMLALKESPLIDKQLTDASAASNYDTVYKQIMKTKLTNYQTSLQQTYIKAKGPKGKKLLNDQYDASKLLLQQLDAASN